MAFFFLVSWIYWKNIGGLSSITAELMNESTENYTSEQMEMELSKLGSDISFGSSGRSTTIFISSLTKNLDKTLLLLAEKLFRPAFNNKDLKRFSKYTRINSGGKTISSNGIIIGSVGRLNWSKGYEYLIDDEEIRRKMENK